MARARKMKHFFYVDHFLHDFGLADIPRNAVEHERIDVRFKLVRLHRRIDRLPPEFNGDLIRNELTLARVFKEGFANLGTRVDGAEHVAAGAVIKARDCAQRFALRPFSAARRTKQDERVISHQRNRFIPQPGRTRKADSTAYFPAVRESTFTRRPARSKRTLPSISAKIV